MASSSASSVQKSFKYDVFLSFRGEDTRKTFVDHLYRALEDRGIITYKDDEKIKKGERINDELMGSIEESKLYIIVFSENYASSSWCLDELVKIMECQRLTEHTAYPIFFDVEPTDIRKQTGSVKRAFAKHTNEEDVRKWREALNEAGGLAGWELKTTADGHEAKVIQKIIKEISPELRYTNFRFDEKLVGMETRLKDVVSSLEVDIENVRMIGIWGMGGAGKTTLARAVYDQISMEFEGSSFVENVREVSNGSSEGLKLLQKQVLSDVLNDQEISVSGVSDGKNKLKRRLCCRKVLVVLDDVDCIDQLEALAGGPNWFKSGSRVIITTRDKKVLLAHRVDFILNINLLSHKESICLFSRYAFGKEIPIQGYEELSKEVVRYAAGLPLTLRVLGSHLCGESDDVWRDALERLKTIPWKETMKILEISYNGLEDDHKEIFLDIACMMKGWEKDTAITALESCGFHAKFGLRVLEQKSLITYGSGWRLGMHDHIEEMGKNIVRCLHPNEPYKHSRLWISKEIEDIFDKDQATEATRCIHLGTWKPHPATIMNGIRRMKGLRFLHVKDYNYTGLNKYKGHGDDFGLTTKTTTTVLQYLPDCLQYLTWEGCPFTCLPNNNICQHLEEGERKVLDKLRYIDLSWSTLRSLDHRLAPNLETLILRHCDNLVDIDMQDKLKYVDLSHTKLTTLNFLPATNLETLILYSCRYLEELYMEGQSLKLKSIDLSRSSVRIVHLGPRPNLELLSLEGCWDLEELYMSVGSVKLKSLELINLPQLKTLNLWPSLNLEELHIDGCMDLVELHMPVELKLLSLSFCGLGTLDLAQVRKLEEIMVKYCVHFSELIMPVGSLELRSLQLTASKLRTLELVREPILEELCLWQCDDLVELHMPVESSKLKTPPVCGLRCLRESFGTIFQRCQRIFTG